jgi:hypothetical protein
MKAWPHRLLFGLAFVFWVLSIVVGIAWMAVAVAVWLPGHLRWTAFMKARREERRTECEAAFAELERLLRGAWRARRLEVEITPGWLSE